MSPVARSRILLVISCYSGNSTGQGGHYYTVRDLALAFSAAWPAASIDILVIGDVFPLPLRDERLTVTHIDFAKKSLRTFTREILSFGEKLVPTHVNSFDNKSHFFGRWIASRAAAKTYLTRPGGPNSRAFFPFAPDIICFSEENMQHLSSRRNLRTAEFHFIPQRVSIPTQDAARIQALRAIVGNGAVLLRICRIGTYYRQSLMQTLALAKAMRSQGQNVSALIIGVVQDQEVFAEIQTISGAADFIITDPYFTVKASELVSTAQAVVGTGRSLVEAALLGKVLLTPLAGSDLPVLVTEHNWRQLAVTNFSERNHLTENASTFDETIHAIIADDKTGANAVAAAMGIDSAIKSYESIYQKPQEQRPLRVDFALNSGAMILRYASTRTQTARREAGLRLQQLSRR